MAQLERDERGGYVAEMPTDECERCDCIHCIARRTNRAFKVNEALLPLGSWPDVYRIADSFGLSSDDFLPSVLDEWAKDFPKHHGAVNGHPIWYMPTVEKWFVDNQALTAARVTRNKKVAEEFAKAQKVSNALGDFGAVLAGEPSAPGIISIRLLPCPECGELFRKAEFGDHINKNH